MRPTDPDVLSELARTALERGGVQGAVMNAAEEVAFDAFCAGHFGFLAMELCPETAASPAVLRRLNGQGARAWKLDFPVHARASAEDEPLVLRIWCPRLMTGATLHAERVAHLLAVPVESALERFQVLQILDESSALPAEPLAMRSGRVRAGMGAVPQTAEDAVEAPRAAPGFLRRVAGAR